MFGVTSVWQISISEAGTIRAKSIPFVVLRPNDGKTHRDPLPSPQLFTCGSNIQQQNARPRFVALRTPVQSHEFHAGMAGLAKRCVVDLEKTTAVRRSSDLAQALRYSAPIESRQR